MTERILDRNIPILMHEDVPCSETRPLYFYRAMGYEVADARIISFGRCNFSCHYCKRGGFFKNVDGSIVGSREITLREVLVNINDAIAKNQVVRLSGGDPVVFQKESMFLGQYVRDRGGRLSMATNGSDPDFCREMAKYLECAAVDLKDVPIRYGRRTGHKRINGEKLFQKSIESQRILSKNGVLVDVRTPVFGITTLDDLRLISESLLKDWNDQMFWTLRPYTFVVGCDWKVPQPNSVISMAKQLKLENPELKLGVRIKWEPSGLVIV